MKRYLSNGVTSLYNDVLTGRVSRREMLKHGSAIGLGAALLGTVPVARPLGAQGTGEPLDLAAMMLQPEDLVAAGLTGYGIRGGDWVSMDAVVMAGAAYRNMPEGEVRAILEGAGLGHTYEILIDLPLTPEDRRSAVARRIRCYAHEFASEEGAMSGFAFIEDESGNSVSQDISVSTALNGAVDVTRRSEMTDDEVPVPQESLDYAFLVGRIHAGVDIIDFGYEGDTVTPPEVADIEVLVKQLQKRILAVQLAGAPGLGPRILRIEGDIAVGPSSDAVRRNQDRYRMIDGTELLLYGDTTATMADTYPGVDDFYEVSYHFGNIPDAPPRAIATLGLLNFADAAAASAWMAAPSENLTVFADQSIQVTDIDVVTNLPALGDEAAAVTLTAQAPDGSTIGQHRHAVRVGNVVSYMNGYRPPAQPDAEVLPPPVDAIQELAAAQVQALNEGAHFRMVAAPAELMA